MLFGCSGELPNETGTTVEVTDPPSTTLPVIVADENRSALPNTTVICEVSIGAPLMFVMLIIPAATVAPGAAVAVAAGDELANAEGVGVGVLAPVAVAVAVRVIVAVAVALGVAALLEVEVAVAVSVADAVAVAVRVAVGVGVALADPVEVAVAVAAGHGTSVTFPHSNPCTSNPVGPPELPKLICKVFIAPAEVVAFIIGGVFKVEV